MIDVAGERRLLLEWQRQGGTGDGFLELVGFVRAWGEMVDHNGLPEPIGAYCPVARTLH